MLEAADDGHFAHRDRGPEGLAQAAIGRLPPLVMGAMTRAGPDSTEMTDIGGRMIRGGRVAELELCVYTNGHLDEEF